VDAEGNLWIAAHPKLLAFVGHAKDSLKRSPSQVLKLTPKAGSDYAVEEMWMDAGDQLSGSSIALRHRDELYVGGVFQPRVIRIGLKKE
jgi:arylesterase/paraoxonase